MKEATKSREMRTTRRKVEGFVTRTYHKNKIGRALIKIATFFRRPPGQVTHQGQHLSVQPDKATMRYFKDSKVIYDI